jgi:hypothetical protein
MLHDVGHMKPRPQSRLSAARIDGDYLFALLAHELQSIPKQLGLTIQGIADSRSHRAVRHLLHDDAGVMLLALRYASDMGLPRQAALVVQALYETLSQLRQDTRTKLDNHAAGLPARLRSELLVSWGRLAQQTSEALAMLARACPGKLDATYLGDSEALTRYMMQCVEQPDCRVGLPALRQRRAMPRAKRCFACSFELADGSTTQGSVEDISAGGMAVSVDQPWQTGQTVTVRLPDGRKLDAQVVNANGRRFGLAFDRPLSATDTLFTSIAEF